MPTTTVTTNHGETVFLQLMDKLPLHSTILQVIVDYLQMLLMEVILHLMHVMII